MYDINDLLIYADSIEDQGKDTFLLRDMVDDFDVYLNKFKEIYVIDYYDVFIKGYKDWEDEFMNIFEHNDFITNESESAGDGHSE